jgi:hypothetical protein
MLHCDFYCYLLLYICVCSHVWSFPCHLHYITFAKYHCSSLYNSFDAIILLFSILENHTPKSFDVGHTRGVHSYYRGIYTMFSW